MNNPPWIFTVPHICITLTYNTSKTIELSINLSLFILVSVMQWIFMDVYVTHCLDHSGNFPVTSCKILLWNARTTASAQFPWKTRTCLLPFLVTKLHKRYYLWLWYIYWEALIHHSSTPQNLVDHMHHYTNSKILVKVDVIYLI